MSIRKSVITIWTAVLLFLAPVALLAGNQAAKDTLEPNEILRASEELKSSDGRYSLALQDDGNLVVYDGRGRAQWSSDTAGSGATECILQDDGNLVLKNRNGRDVWATHTDGVRNARLMMQNDGNLVIYNKRGLPVWAKGMIKSGLSRDENLLTDEFLRSQNRTYTLILQGDGNLVGRDGRGRSFWNSGTVGSGAVECVLQGDGNLVLKNRNRREVWATKTDGHPNARLVLEDDGQVVLYEEDGTAFWSNGVINTKVEGGLPSSSGYSALTGDSDFDMALNTLNNDALADPGSFATRLSETFGVSSRWIDNLVRRESVPPADVYMIAKMASVTNRPADTIEDYYLADRGRGWGAVAERLGIRPGSQQFRALKQDDAGFLRRGARQGRIRRSRDER